MTSWFIDPMKQQQQNWQKEVKYHKTNMLKMRIYYVDNSYHIRKFP